MRSIENTIIACTNNLPYRVPYGIGRSGCREVSEGVRRPTTTIIMNSDVFLRSMVVNSRSTVPGLTRLFTSVTIG